MDELTAKTVRAKYVFLDIVGYSRNRSVEAQTYIINAMNEIAKTAIQIHRIPRRKYIPLSTGDGLCIALLDIDIPYDVHLEMSRTIVFNINKHNGMQDNTSRKFEVRIGINENTDNIVKDFSGRRNIAGAGINYAQRIMDMADNSQILLSSPVHATLSQREKYTNKFRHFSGVIKHGEQIEVYQFIEPENYNLNSEPPSRFVSPKRKFEPNLSMLTAFYFAFCIKFKDQVKNLLIEPIDPYALRLTYVYLAKDFLNMSSRTEFTIDPSFILKDAVTEREVDINKALQIIKNSNVSMIIDLADFYMHSLIYNNNLSSFFKSESEKIYLTAEGEKLVNTKYPEVIEYVGLK